MTESTLSPIAEEDIGYGHLLKILVRRGFWFIGTFGVTLAASAFMAVNTKPAYESSMQLLVEPNFDEERNLPELAGSADPSRSTSRSSQTALVTQLNLMRSHEFIQDAVNLLISDYPGLTAETVKHGFKLTQVSEGKVETRIFKAVYVDTDPVKTQKVIEALQEVYLDYNLDQQEQRLTRGLAFINEQLKNARQNLQVSQDALEQFRELQNLIDPNKQAEAVTNALNRIMQEQQDVEAQYEDAEALYATLQEQLSLSPEIALTESRLSQSARYQTLLNELQQTELALAERRVVFSDTDPSVQTLFAQRQNQILLLRQEIERVLGQSQAEAVLPPEGLLNVGQMSTVDLGLVRNLAEVQANLASLEARYQSLVETEQSLREELNYFPGLIAEYDRLQPEVDIDRSVLQKLLEEKEIVSAKLARGGFNWQVVESPQLGKKVGPSAVHTLMLGGVVGIFLGGIVAFIREAIDNAVHSPEDLEKQTALPLLGSLPSVPLIATDGLSSPLRLNQTSLNAGFGLELMQQPLFREALDLIYKNIQLLGGSPKSESITITSALPGEGKSTLILGLALSAARQGRRVLVIDADLRRPSLHERLNLPNDRGLTSLLKHGPGAAKPIQLSLMDVKINVLPAGLESTDPVRLLASQRMGRLMAALKEAYDLVLLDTPPLLEVVDALQVGTFCNSTILISRLEQVTQTELRKAITQLSRLKVLGIVANGSKSKPMRYVGWIEQTPEELNHMESLNSEPAAPNAVSSRRY
ncbi:MAG: polysaccharide biosynthesis tyrosine autokinase [Leptolyngbyaceae cyanobacterium MO_188.B28]|nr:polysaccharide biosynthesis tyrosine autokinase [Leptolyngbyaceae cyanobacterium MO_188.B28]